ncbi:MAG TPA: cytochrome c [Gammaproteobacteria bacterium]|nr:cytochrome c [Gammaproteobacteria bacterium]
MLATKVARWQWRTHEQVDNPPLNRVPRLWHRDPAAIGVWVWCISEAAGNYGQNGISVAPIYPNLAGQKDEYLIAQLKAFRDGTRINPIMNPMAKGLSDIDIANLAAYLSALKVP